MVATCLDDKFGQISARKGAELIDSVLNVVRRKRRATSASKGFQVCRTLGAGTGSFMGRSDLEGLRVRVVRVAASQTSSYTETKHQDGVCLALYS